MAFIDNLIGYFFVFAGVRLFSIGENAELGLIIGLVLYIALQLYFMKTYRQTLGKYWLNIRVLDLCKQINQLVLENMLLEKF